MQQYAMQIPKCTAHIVLPDAARIQCMAPKAKNFIFHKKRACGNREDDTKADTPPQKSRRASFLQRQNVCNNWEDLSKPNTCHQIAGTLFSLKEKRLRQPGRHSSTLHSVHSTQHQTKVHYGVCAGEPWLYSATL